MENEYEKLRILTLEGFRAQLCEYPSLSYLVQDQALQGRELRGSRDEHPDFVGIPAPIARVPIAHVQDVQLLLPGPRHGVGVV